MTQSQEENKRYNAPIEDIFDLYMDFIKTIDKRKNTIRNYGTNKRVICSFAREYYGRNVSIKNINLSFDPMCVARPPAIRGQYPIAPILPRGRFPET